MFKLFVATSSETSISTIVIEFETLQEREFAINALKTAEPQTSYYFTTIKIN
jgi:hypothetical protein